MKYHIPSLKACRSKNVAISQLASELNVTLQTLYYWNQGHALPRLPVLVTLARLLEMPLDDLVKETPNNAED